MIRRPPRSTRKESSAASDVYKRQGLISPPVGMNMFVVKSLLPHLDTSTIFRGVMPFVYTLVGVLALLVAFPPIILIVPQLLKM